MTMCFSCSPLPGFTSAVDIKDIYESSLLYEREKTARWPGKEDEVVVVSKILQKLCMNPRADSEASYYIYFLS